ncbi:MAG: DUF4474 domain-containing protein, partial [Ruminococcus sp.]|nr:DUF4474 domain-containing protein [Candidatus Copronaster equi]
CNLCGAQWSYNQEEEQIEVKDENGNTVDTVDYSSGFIGGGSGSSGGSYSGGGNSSGNNSGSNSQGNQGNNNNNNNNQGGSNSNNSKTTTTKKKPAVSPEEAFAMVKDLGKIVKAGVGEVVMDENGNLTVNNHPGQDTGLFGYKYSTNEKCFITAEDSWQRNFGFEETYDTAAGVGAMSYDTIRIFFEYDNKEWMVQLWKGQYGLAFIGAEIGIYTRPLGSAVGTYYNCANDDEKLVMSMDVTRTALNTGAYEPYSAFHRNPANTWWLTAFVPGTLQAGTYVVPEDATKKLQMDSKIVFDSPEQAQAFMQGLKNVDHIYHNMPVRSRKINFTELNFADYDARRDLSAKFALNDDGKTVRFSWR